MCNRITREATHSREKPRQPRVCIALGGSVRQRGSLFSCVPFFPWILLILTFLWYPFHTKKWYRGNHRPCAGPKGTWILGPTVMKIWRLWFLSEQDVKRPPAVVPTGLPPAALLLLAGDQSSHLPLPWFLVFYSGSSEVEKIIIIIIISQVRSAFFFLKGRIVQMRCPLSPPPLVLSLPILLPSCLIRPLPLTSSVATSM